MKIASIDLGTNTALLYIGEIRDGILHNIYDQQTIVRLGQGLGVAKKFSSDAMERTLHCLKEYAHIAQSYQCDEVLAVATSASRDAENAESFYEKILRETGIGFRIISGEEEARLTFLGGIPAGLSVDDVCLIDIGGGSTEFVGHSFAVSLQAGSVRYYEKYGDGSACLDKIRSQMTHLLKGFDNGPSDKLKQLSWVGVAGTITTLAAFMMRLDRFDANRINSLKMQKEDIQKAFQELTSMSADKRAQIPVIGEGRKDVIVPGVAVLLIAMEYFGKEEMFVSTTGLRQGVVLDFIKKANF